MKRNTKGKKVKEEEIIYSINEKEKTANIVGNKCTKPDLIIPRTIFHKGQEFIIKSIKENSFTNTKIIRTVRFANDSEVDLIEQFSFGSSSIEEIYLPPHLKCICRYAFSSCQKLQVVDIPQNSELQKIGVGAFEYSVIEKLTLPSSISELDEGWCHGTPKLRNVIYYPNSRYIYLDGKYIIGKSEISRNEYDKLIFARRDLESATIPSNVKIIGAYSFTQTQIKKISIPSQVTEIHSFAFYKCQNLSEIYFETDSQLRVIGKFAFSQSSLASILIPSHVEEICDHAFGECTNLLQVEFSADSELQIIGLSSFERTTIQIISIPSSVREIRGKAFHYCVDLTTVIIPEDSKLQTIGDFAFGITSIESLFIPANVSKIEDNWCYDTPNLREVKVSEDSKDFINYGMNNEFVIGKSDSKLQTIGDFAFIFTSNESFFIPANVLRIEDNRCNGTPNLREVIVSEDSKDFINYGNNNEFVVGESDSNKFKFDFLVFVNRKQKIVTIPPFIKTIGKSSFNSSSIERLTIPREVTRICEFAFAKCLDLRYVDFEPDSSLQIIDELAFAESSIESFQVPPCVTHISETAFSECTNLQIIEFDEHSSIEPIDDIPFVSNFGEHFLIMIPSKLLTRFNE